MLVEVNLQLGSLLDVDRLGSDFTVQAFGPDGELIGEYHGDWEGLIPGFMYRGVFRLPLQGSSVGSVRVTPGADVRVMGLSTDDPTAASALMEGQAARAQSAVPVAVPGLNGTPECATIAAPDVALCGEAVGTALADQAILDADPAQVQTTHSTAPNGSPHCLVSSSGTPAFVLAPTGVVSSPGGVAETAADSGCAVRSVDPARSAHLVSCEQFSALVWLSAQDAVADLADAIQDENEEDARAALEDLGVIFEILFAKEFRDGYEGSEEELFNAMMEVMDALYEDAGFQPAYPRE